MRAVAMVPRFVLLLSLIAVVGGAQYTEQNVNMVSGTDWPKGDPFLRQQNEPNVAVSTRNPLHLLAGANDYRTVDIPFNAPVRPDGEDTGDAWLGWFKSKDGGNTWFSGLIDGYPQQGNLSSPLNGFQAAADAVVRAGNNGMFYYIGIVLNRGNNPLGGVFLTRLMDKNNSEVSDPIAAIDQKMIDNGASGQFIDKPSFAVAPMTNGGQCTVAGQTFAAQNLYLAYTIFVGGDNNIRTKIMFARSTDCGVTWGTQKLSETFSINQASNIVVDPNSGAVYVVWRRFAGGNDPNSIIVAKSTNGGVTFTKGAVATNITPFEQGTTTVAIRTNAYPAAAVDNSGRLYIAWSQRMANGDGRILLINSTDAVTWSSPIQVDTFSGRGHQFMPSMTFSGGKLTLAWYDLREDHTILLYHPIINTGLYSEDRRNVGNLPGNPEVVFTNYLMDVAPNGSAVKLVRRHTLDVIAADSNGGVMPTFTYAQVTRYKFGSRPNSPVCAALGYAQCIEQLQVSPPNLPMFRQGTVPFLGDYIDIAAYVSSSAPTNAPTSSVPTRIRHVVWTDNRDVRPPKGTPPDWTKYTPVHSPALGSTSKFDPTQVPPPCNADFAGSRNQNIYSARVTDGMFAGSPGNAKPLGKIQRAFTVFVQNARNTKAAYRLSIPQQPPGGRASFLQFQLLDRIDVTIPPHSTATRSVFVDNTVPAHTRIDVNVTEITMAGGSELAGGLSTVVSLNPDITNPDITNPDITNPDITNSEVVNPDITNPDITNPDITNPDITNPDITNPDITNPDITNPDITNPDITNPDITNPDITNPDITNPDITNSDLTNGAAKDTNWSAKNQGNTTGGFTVKLLNNGTVPPGFHLQLTITKTYDTPTARNCELGVEHHRQVMTNVNNPTFATLADLTNPGLTDSSDKSVTMWLAPGESGRITLRVIDPDRFDNVTFDAAASVTPVVIAQSVNTADANGDNPTPSISLTILTASLADGIVGQSYNAPLSAIGGRDPKTWTATGLPAGLVVTGAAITGTPQVAGTFPVTITVTDSFTPPHVKSKTLPLVIHGEKTFVVTNTNDSGSGSLRQAILDANASVGFTDKILFTIAGAAPHVITPASALPTINDPVVIDATASGSCDGSAPSVEIDGVSAGSATGFNVVGGGTTIRGLAITRFAGRGVSLSGGGSVVQCSYVGLATDGATTKGNSGDGVFINSSNNTIGGTGAARNVVSANGGEGIRIDRSTGNVLRGNYVGTNASGTADLGNNNSGVYIRYASNNTVRDGVISGNNGFAGVAICGTPSFCGGGNDTGGSASNNVVRGNLIGTNAAGTAALGNSGYGVSLDGTTNNVIGGSDAGEGNVMAASGNDGIRLFGTAPDGNVIRGNSIGTDAGATVNLGNTGAGVRLVTGSNNTISGADVNVGPNVIAFNGGAGITLEAGAGSGNLLHYNSIDSNAGLGIDLGADGVTGNDAADADTGPNGLQNFPVLASVKTGGGATVIDGSIQTTPNTQFTVDYFSSPTCDGSGFGEGKTWFAGFTATTNADGFLSFRSDVTIALPLDSVVTATATAANSTSEFSACVPVENNAGRALRFDGNDLVSVADATSLTLQALTIEGWIKIDDPNFDFAPLISKGSQYGNYTLNVGGDQGDGTLPRNVNYVHQIPNDGNFSCCSVTPGPLQFGVWTHIAASFSGGVARVYKNGALIATVSDGPAPATNNAAVTLGRVAFITAPTHFFKGLIDEVRVWNVARSDAEIAANYNKSINGNTPNLVGYWRFDEIEGQSVIDASPYGNHGTLGSDNTAGADDPGRVVSTAPIRP